MTAQFTLRRMPSAVSLCHLPKIVAPRKIEMSAIKVEMELNMKKMAQMVGTCGLYCGTCPHHLAPIKNDAEQLETISRERDVPVEEIRCDGCHSENVFGPCKPCPYGIRECAAAKGLKWCFDCDEFPCEILEDFSKQHVVNGICHHTHAIAHLKKMKEQGVEEWAGEEDRAGRCPKCGALQYWFARECGDCGEKIQ